MSESPLGDVARINGQWYVRDPDGKVIDGPFPHMGAAASALTRRLIAAQRTPTEKP